MKFIFKDTLANCNFMHQSFLVKYALLICSSFLSFLFNSIRLRQALLVHFERENYRPNNSSVINPGIHGLEYIIS